MPRRPDIVDTLLLIIFLVGIYTGINFNAAPGLPVPAVIAGAAGGLMLFKHLHQVQERHLVALLAVILLFLFSILSVTDYTWLNERFKGFVQLSYSLIIGYGVFLTIINYDRNRLARIFIAFCLLIVIGCALENYTGFVAVSDAFRERVYDFGLYRSDLRDQLLYGRVRPKLFTSEPSAVTFAFSLYAFCWYVLSTWRIKLVIYAALLGAGFYLMRGPTLMLALVLVVPYQLFLASRWVFQGRAHYSIPRLAGTLVLSAILLLVAGALTTTFYAERLDDIASGQDPSFFYRVIGPALTALEIVTRFPVTGSGLTGEEGIEDYVVQVFINSPQYSADWGISSVAEVLTNYFWYHWIYLGAVWGLILLVALSWWLRVLGVPSVLFCWIVWATFGQASGAYVSPKTWTVLLLAGAVSILNQRQPAMPRTQVPVARPREHREPYLRAVATSR